jgi:uncharacterized protein (DUF2141 family)
MKKTITAFLMLFCTLSCAAFAQDDRPETGTINISVGNLRSTDGMVGIALFRSEEGFPGKPERALKGKSVPAAEHCVMKFENMPYGTYAVSVLHDENGNGKMDKTFIGIPREGFGTSNNPKLRMGPPLFSESCFELSNKEVTLSINMNYLRQRPAPDKQ